MSGFGKCIMEVTEFEKDRAFGLAPQSKMLAAAADLPSPPKVKLRE
jgi:hypothetical protein